VQGVLPGGCVLSGACRADVDLPADTVLVGDRAEDIAPELPGQLGPDRAAAGETVEQGLQLRLVGADERQLNAGLRVGALVSSRSLARRVTSPPVSSALIT
jgi:hypothetical protein